MSAAPRLRDFGHEPEPALLDLLRALTGAAPPTATAIALAARAAAGDADKGIQKLLPLVRGNPELTAAGALIHHCALPHGG